MTADSATVVDAPKWHFNLTDRIQVKGQDYTLVQSISDGHMLRQLDNPKIVISLTDEEIEALRKKLQLKVTRFAFLESTAYLDSVVSGMTFADFSYLEKREIFFRVDVCQALLMGRADRTISLTDESLRPALTEIWLGWIAQDISRHTQDGRHGSKISLPIITKPSPSTAKRWLRIYKACDFNPLALAKQYGKSGNKNSKVSATVRAIVDAHARGYVSRLQPTKASAYRKVKQDIEVLNAQIDRDNKHKQKSAWKPRHTEPCLDTLYLAIDKINKFEVLAGRIGDDAARKKLAIQHGGLNLLRPMQRLEMDEWEIPLQILLENAGIWSTLTKREKDAIERDKYWLVTVFEGATGLCLAAKVVRKPSAAAAVEALNMSCNDKTAYALMAGCEKPWDQCGIGDLYATDNGVFKQVDFRGALVDLRATHMLLIAGVPALKGGQERGYRTFHDQLIAHWSGRTFDSVVRRGDYDSEGQACIDGEELGRIIIRFIVDVYHITGHAGLNGKTPLDRWNELRKVYRISPPLDPDQNRHVFGTPAYRQIGNYGIRFLGLNYQSKALQVLRSKLGKRNVLIRVDSHNLGAISVRSDEGWISVPCVRRGIAYVPVFQWLMAVRELRKENAEQAKFYAPTVFRALRDIQQFADDARSRANIASPVYSDKAFRKFERDLFAGFDILEQDDENTDALDFTYEEMALPEHPYDGERTPSTGPYDDLSEPWFGVEE